MITYPAETRGPEMADRRDAGSTPAYFSILGCIRLIILGALAAFSALLLLFATASGLADRYPGLPAGVLALTFSFSVGFLHWRRFRRRWLVEMGVTPFAGTWVVVLQTFVLWGLAILAHRLWPGPETGALGHRTFWDALLVTVLVSPVAEELLFRQLLYRCLMVSWRRPVPVAMVTAVLWGTIHFNYSLAQQVELFIIGLYYFYLRWRYDSLLAPLLSHSVHNLAIVALVWMQVSL